VAVISLMRRSGEVAPFESQVSTRAYTEKIRNDKSASVWLMEQYVAAAGSNRKSCNQEESQSRGPEVLVLYLKRPRAKELGVETLWRGASDTAT